MGDRYCVTFHALWVLAIAALPGCAYDAPGDMVEPLRAGVISFDSDGQARDPIDDKPLTETEFAARITNVLGAMDRYHRDHPDPMKRILIFVHGGLTTPDQALERAVIEMPQIKCAGYYPIFVNWDTGLTSSYFEHAARVSQGRKEYSGSRGTGRLLLSPLYLGADLGRAITRAPLVWAEQIATDVHAAASDVAVLHERQKDNSGGRCVPYPPLGQTGVAWLELNRRYLEDRRSEPPDVLPRPLPGCPGASTPAATRSTTTTTRTPAAAAAAATTTTTTTPTTATTDARTGRPLPREMRVSIKDSCVSSGEVLGMGAWYVVTAPVKFGTSWFIDGFGQPAWNNMTRRTLTLFEGRALGTLAPEREEAAQERRQERQDLRARVRPDAAATTYSYDSTGGLQMFIDRLAAHVKAADGNPGHEITLIGHSMGSMVLNEWIRRNDQFTYRNIVYMAAACSVRDVEQSVVPYLRRHREGPRRARFYNLTLHPTADLRERDRFWDTPPRGSLLVWIDDFLGSPRTTLDRTFGRFDNCVKNAHVIHEEVKGQVTMKAFGLAASGLPSGQDLGPQMHGHFRGRRYWEPAFWQADPPRGGDDELVEKTRDVARRQRTD
jgi:hypothetical protein